MLLNTMNQNFHPEEKLFPNDPSAIIEFYSNSEIPLTPEKQLMMAILEDAIFCFSSGTRTKSKSKLREFKRAKVWFFSDWKGFYSFKNICQELNLSSDYIRHGLMQVKKQIKLRRSGATSVVKIINSPRTRLLSSQKGKFSRNHKFECIV